MLSLISKAYLVLVMFTKITLSMFLILLFFEYVYLLCTKYGIRDGRQKQKRPTCTTISFCFVAYCNPVLAKTSLPTVTLLSLNAFSNSALFVYTVSLYVTDVKDEQLENTLYSILVTLSGIVMDVKPAQSLNALLSMVFTLSGIVMDAKPEQHIG